MVCPTKPVPDARPGMRDYVVTARHETSISLEPKTGGVEVRGWGWSLILHPRLI